MKQLPDESVLLEILEIVKAAEAKASKCMNFPRKYLTIPKLQQQRERKLNS